MGPAVAARPIRCPAPPSVWPGHRRDHHAAMRDPDITVLDPGPLHLDEAAVRTELTRVFDVCRDCRLCIDRCDVFPTLFATIGRTTTGEAGMMTPADQDLVVDSCHGCAACRHGCPFAPGLHDAAVDVPSLMLRAVAMRRATGQQRGPDRRAAWVLGSPRRWTLLAALPRGVRGVASRAAGLSVGRIATAARRPRTGRRRADSVPMTGGPGVPSAIVVPTCLAGSFRPSLHGDLIAVAEHLGVTCRTAGAGCCGAPALHAGDLRRFRRSARRMVAALDEPVASGAAVVVPEATCAEVMRRHHPEVLGGAAAARVAAAVVSPVEFLSRVAGGADVLVGRATTAPTGETVVLVAGPEGPQGRETVATVAVLEAFGHTVTVAESGAGVSGPWGLRATAEVTASGAWERLAAQATSIGADGVLSGDVVWPVTPGGIGDPSTVTHPAEVIARALLGPGDVDGGAGAAGAPA